MPQRTKSSVKSGSPHSEAVQRRTTKRLRIDSDEDEDDGYEPLQERRTTYNESYTRGGAAGPSSPSRARSVSTTKRQRLPASDEEGSEDKYRGRSYIVPHEDEYTRDDEEPAYSGNSHMDDEDDDGEYEGGDGAGRLRKKRRTPVSSPLSWKTSSPPTAPAQQPTSSNADHGRSGGTRPRKLSFKAQAMSASRTTSTKETAGASTKKSTVMAKGKQKAATTSKRKRKQPEESEEEEEYNDLEDEEVNVDEDEGEARSSDEYDDFEEEERPTKSKKGRGGAGRRGAKTREKDKGKDMAPILKKAKFEGAPPPTAGSTAKRTRVKQLAEEESVVDIMDESGTPDASSIGSPAIAATGALDGTKDSDTPASSAAPPKKRKLPTIKKLKSSASLGGPSTGTGTGPSTPSSSVAAASKSSGLPGAASSAAASGASKLGIDKSARPKTNATTDLDLSNPSLYAELFKNPGAGASKTGLNRRAKEEERKKELDKLRDDYKSKFTEDVTTSFDLQGQAEKMARFEEVLRHRRSSALYPNFLAAKWREEWEREKRRAHRQEYQPQASQQHGHTDDTKEEGEM